MEVPRKTLYAKRRETFPLSTSAFSAVRVMVNVNQTGEAAGVACALALDSGQSLSDLSPQKVRETLAKGGSVIL